MMPPRNWAAYLMRSSNSSRSRAAWVREFIGLWTVLAIGLGLLVRPAAAAPFAYVANTSFNISMIDTATNMVVATIPTEQEPIAVAITPDGHHAYVAFAGEMGDFVLVYDTSTNKVAATILGVAGFGTGPGAIAVTPDGPRAYVANSSVFGPFETGSVSVIDTATNKVVATVRLPAFSSPVAVAITPDGTHAYAANESTNGTGTGTVSVVATASNTVVATIPLGTFPGDVAITPEGHTPM